MEKLKKIVLVDGQFSSREMSDILIDMIMKKIQFHELRNLQNFEILGKMNDTSVKRIEELKKIKAQVLSFAQEQESTTNVYAMKAFIEIEELPERNETISK